MTMQRESGDQATSDAPSAGSALTEPRSHEPVDVRRLYELYARLASETDLQGALDAILAAACELTRTERGCIQLLSDNGARLELFAWRGYGDQDPFVARFRRDGLVCGAGAALTSGARLVV
jgi:GAF domain-containing protein